MQERDRRFFEWFGELGIFFGEWCGSGDAAVRIPRSVIAARRDRSKSVPVWLWPRCDRVILSLEAVKV